MRECSPAQKENEFNLCIDKYEGNHHDERLDHLFGDGVY
jgi:hypothetical protein